MMWDFVILILLMFGVAWMLVNVVEFYEYIGAKVLQWLQKDKWF